MDMEIPDEIPVLIPHLLLMNKVGKVGTGMRGSGIVVNLFFMEGCVRFPSCAWASRA